MSWNAEPNPIAGEVLATVNNLELQVGGGIPNSGVVICHLRTLDGDLIREISIDLSMYKQFRSREAGGAEIAALVERIPEWREPRTRVVQVLDAWATLLPARVVDEDLGDYIEDIGRRSRNGQRSRVWLRGCAAVFWTSVNAIGYFLEHVGKRKKA